MFLQHMKSVKTLQRVIHNFALFAKIAQSLFLVSYGLLFGLLFAVVAFAFTFVAAIAVQIALGNVVRVYPETVQGLKFYHSKIYITKILACDTSVESLLWSPQLVTSIT